MVEGTFGIEPPVVKKAPKDGGIQWSASVPSERIPQVDEEGEVEDPAHDALLRRIETEAVERFRREAGFMRKDASPRMTGGGGGTGEPPPRKNNPNAYIDHTQQRLDALGVKVENLGKPAVSEAPPVVDPGSTAKLAELREKLAKVAPLIEDRMRTHPIPQEVIDNLPVPPFENRDAEK